MMNSIRNMGIGLRRRCCLRSQLEEEEDSPADTSVINDRKKGPKKDKSGKHKGHGRVHHISVKHKALNPDPTKQGSAEQADFSVVQSDHKPEDIIRRLCRKYQTDPMVIMCVLEEAEKLPTSQSENLEEQIDAVIRAQLGLETSTDKPAPKCVCHLPGPSYRICPAYRDEFPLSHEPLRYLTIHEPKDSPKQGEDDQQDGEEMLDIDKVPPILQLASEPIEQEKTRRRSSKVLRCLIPGCLLRCRRNKG